MMYGNKESKLSYEEEELEKVVQIEMMLNKIESLNNLIEIQEHLDRLITDYYQ